MIGVAIIGVRSALRYFIMSGWTNWLSHFPLKEEITGSRPVPDTNEEYIEILMGVHGFDRRLVVRGTCGVW